MLTWLWVYLFIPILLGFASGLVRPLSYGVLNKIEGAKRVRSVTLAEFLFAFFNAIFLVIIAAMFEWNMNNALLILIISLSVLSLYQGLHHYYLVMKSRAQSQHTSIANENEAG
ncbi:hypothetical protein D3C78_1602470 [compost metagenome]